MFNAISYSRSDLATALDEEDTQYKTSHGDKTKLGTLSQDDVSTWVMGTIRNKVQQHMQNHCQNQMRIDNVI
jgi:hypothetical protein